MSRILEAFKELGVEKLTDRQWMIADALWVPHSKRKPRIYQPRYRRDCLGELVQIDGSHHDWFEGRADKCCLLVFINDATGRLMNLRFRRNRATSQFYCYAVTIALDVITSFRTDDLTFFQSNKKATRPGRLKFCDIVTLLYHKSHLAWSAHSNG